MFEKLKRLDDEFMEEQYEREQAEEERTRQRLIKELRQAGESR